jgi:hypothetical protein
MWTAEREYELLGRPDHGSARESLDAFGQACAKAKASEP